MNNMMKFAVSLPLALMASTALAGGMEKTALSTAFMYEAGSYAELSFQNSDYDVSSSWGGNVSVVNDFTTSSFAFKFDLNDQLSFGIARYRQANIGLDYQSNWVSSVALPSAGLPVALLDVDATVGLGRYEFSENFSVLGGVKISNVQDATLKIPTSTPFATDAAIVGDSETSYIYGVVYERPEIALRAELIREEEVSFTLDTTLQDVPTAGTTASALTTASLPNYTTLNLQSGIAADTLVFASVRRADWGTHHVALNGTQISTYSDTTTYSVGVGRKFTESLSGSLSYNWEDGTGPTSTSALSLSDGYRGISAGVKYTMGDLTISGGVNFTSLGDVNVTQLGGAPFADNTVTTVGLRLGYHF